MSTPQGKNARKREARQRGELTGAYHCPTTGKLYASKTSAKRDAAKQTRRDARHGMRAGVITAAKFDNPTIGKVKFSREREGVHHWKTFSQK